MGNMLKIVLAGLMLMAACAVAGHAQPAGPPYYTSDTAPTADVLSKSYQRYFGKKADAITVIGVHKVTDTEFLILSGTQDKPGTPASKTTMYSLWRLESKEWVMADPFFSGVRYIKVLSLDPKDSKP